MRISTVPAWQRLLWPAVLNLLVIPQFAVAAEPLVFEAGTPIASALDQLRQRGLRVLYSSALVPADLLTSSRVSGDDEQALAVAILAPHGMGLRPLGSGVLGVVELRGAPRWWLRGQVRSEAGGLPLAGARVELVGQGFVAWSARDGQFELPMQGRSPQSLHVVAPGHRAIAEHVSFAGGNAQRVEISLPVEAVRLDEVTILASRFTFDGTTATKPVSIGQHEILLQPKLGDDALQATAHFPGFSFSGVSGRPNVRGGEAGEVMVLLDGMPIREAYHLPDYNSAFSMFDESLIARIDAHTGPLPARYGNRLASIVDLDSTSVDASAPRSVSLSNFNAGLRWGQRNSASAFGEQLLAARIGTLGAWIEDYSPDVGRPQYGDVFLKLRRSYSNDSELLLAALGARSKLSYFDPDTTERAQLASRTTYAWLRARTVLSENTRIEAMLGFSAIDSEREGSLAGGLAPIGELTDRRRSRFVDGNLRLLQSLPQHSIDAGLAFAIGRGRYGYESTVEYDPTATTLFAVTPQRSRRALFELRRWTAAAHLADRWEVAPRWYLESGLRADVHGGAGRDGAQLNPHLALRWDAAPSVTLRGSWGRASQAPEAHELRVEDGERQFGNAQRVQQSVLSLELRPNPATTLLLELFERRQPNPRLRFENLLDPLRFVPELAPDRTLVAPLSSRVHGLEASLRHESGAWSFRGAYTLARAVDRMRIANVARDWDQRHTLTLGATWQRGPWSVSMFGQAHTGRPTTSVVDTNLDSLQLGARNAARLASFVSVDLRAAREFNPGIGRIVVFAQLSNLLNRANPCCTEIDLPDEESDPTQLEIEPIPAYPVLPAIGIRWDF